MEPLPEAPVPLPNEAPHLLERLAAGTPEYVSPHRYSILCKNKPRNSSTVMPGNTAVPTISITWLPLSPMWKPEKSCICRNATFQADEKRGNQVDIITSPRSTGSILKPFLYAGMLHDGQILPSTLVSDVPLNINGFMPQNYNKTFNGAVPAHRAIERSLNVPLVRMLSQYNTGRFMTLLKTLGMTSLRFSEEHYGASLILGGAEGTLWDISGMYASLSRVLTHYRPYNGRYNPQDIHPLTVLRGKGRFANHPYRHPDPVGRRPTTYRQPPFFQPPPSGFTYEAMSALNRPEEEADWQQFESMKQIAWKTGTSYGGRDAWAIGTTPRYVVGVWVGNASGEGRPGLTGVGNAAPVLFDLFSLLPGSSWFDMPYDELEQAVICRNSGHKASPDL